MGKEYSKIPGGTEFVLLDPSINFDSDINIRRCYEHFIMRVRERTDIHIPNEETYWEIFVKRLRGKLIRGKIGKERMPRLMGNYHKDEVIYKIIYTKIRVINIYVPLTIYEVTDICDKIRLHGRTTKNIK